jgi:hypothetical protein
MFLACYIRDIADADAATAGVTNRAEVAVVTPRVVR